MASNGTRIPAWRRLGLALKNEDQSATIGGAEISPSNLPQVKSRDAQIIAPNETPVSVAQASKGREEKLGKRKHRSESQDGPAEDDDQASKKRKQSHDQDSTNATAVTSISPTEAPQTVEPTETARPKGDPNYRKKKEKPNKRRNDQTAATQPSKPTKAPKNSFPEKTDREVLLASTETADNDLKDSNLLSTPRTDRRKSVAFTPDTKTVDGHTGQDLFKKWVAEQKGATQTDQELTSSPSRPEKKSEKKPEKKLEKNPIAPVASTNEQPSESAATSKPSKSTTEAPKPKKKDHSAYISYLTQYHTDRDNWKFNKAKQNDIIDNALNIFRIPSQHSEALFEYIAGLKGAGVIERLKERCNATLKDLTEQESKSTPSMNDQEAREAMKQEALQEGLKKGKKRRMVEADAEDLASHPAGDARIRHMQRERAEALLMHLGRTAPVLPAVHTNVVNPSMKHLAPPVRDARKRKRRTDISSDEESSSSDSDAESDSDSSSDSESDSESDAGSDTSSSNGSSNSSDSDSDSDSDSSGRANSDDNSSDSDASESGSTDDADSDSDDSSSDSDSD